MKIMTLFSQSNVGFTGRSLISADSGYRDPQK